MILNNIQNKILYFNINIIRWLIPHKLLKKYVNIYIYINNNFVKKKYKSL